MANPTGFNPFPQQQQMGQFDIINPMVTSSMTPQQNLHSSSFTQNSQTQHAFSSQIITPCQNSNFQSSPVVMPTSFSMNNMGSPFGDLGNLNGNSSSASGGLFLNNNEMVMGKPVTNGAVADQFG